MFLGKMTKSYITQAIVKSVACGNGSLNVVFIHFELVSSFRAPITPLYLENRLAFYANIPSKKSAGETIMLIIRLLDVKNNMSWLLPFHKSITG